MLLIGGFASLPFVIKWRQGSDNLTQRPGALGGNAIMRGPYTNSGSRDVGADPDWDMKTGTYSGSSVQRFKPSPEQVAEHRRALEATLAAHRPAPRPGGGGGGGGGQPPPTAPAPA